MSMSRRHFITLAAAIRETSEDVSVGREIFQPGLVDYTPEMVIGIITNKIIRICREENPDFDYARFVAACQPEVVA